MSENMAKQILSKISEENIVIAIWWKRAIAYVLDSMFIVGILMLVTQGRISDAWDLNLLLYDDRRYLLLFIINWFLLFAGFWLYFKYTGKIMQRSLGQRFMKLAIIYGDGTMVPENNWGKRAFYKLRYILPIPLGQLIGVMDLVRIIRSDTHQSRIDWYTNTIVVMDWSLPNEIRAILK